MKRNLHYPRAGLLLWPAVWLAACTAAMAQTPSPAEIERPAAAAAELAALPQRPVVKGYSVPLAQLDAVTAALQKQFPENTGIRVLADAPTSQVVVIGPSAAQDEAARWLNAALAPAAQAAAATAPQSTLPPPATEPMARTTHALANLSARDIEQTLARAWGNAAAFAPSPDQKSTVVRAPAAGQSGVALLLDHERDLVTIDASQKTLNSWLRFVQSIDAPRRGNDMQTDFVSLRRAQPEKIKEIVGLLRAAVESKTGRRGPRNHIGEFVSMIFQPGDAQPQPGGLQPPPPPPDQGAQPAQPGDQELGAVPGGETVAETLGRIGNVRIEFIQDLGVIIISGNRRDVERVKRLIEEIEEISKQTLPEVEVYYLQHVNGQAMSELINTVYPQIFAARLGTVTVTPLVKPNAVLIVGRKEAITSVSELIQRLDQPVAPQTQLRVFQLKFLPAIDAERTVRSIFSQRPGFTPDERTGLGTRVLVIADFRSNSLIVQASPRDLEEVDELLRRIDVPDSEATNEVKVFKLKNSLAEELAPILEEAITGEIAGQQVQQQQFQQGQAGGTSGTPTPAQSTRRSTSIQLLQVDPNGQRIIKSGILSDFRVRADARNNQLIISGPAQSMPLMEELIRQLDTLPGAEAQVKVFTMENGDATQLATMLQTLFGLQTGQQAGQFPFGAQSVTGAGETSLVPLRFAVDTRTNSIIASGSAGDLTVVYSILARLDISGIRQREIKVFRLKNTSATAVADSLNRYLQSQQQLLQAQQQGQLVTTVQALEEQVIVVDEPVTNSLIVNATARYMSEVVKMIEDLDKRNPMVVIQLLIAEVTLSDFDEFGAEFGLQDALLFRRSVVTDGVATPGFNFNNQPLGNFVDGVNTKNTAGQALTDLALDRTNAALGFGGLVLSASSESVSILIRALQQSNRVQILSRPQIQTSDNQPAFVQVGRRIARLRGTTLTTGASQSNIEDVNVGIILGVTPRVAPDGMVILEIDAEKSEVSEEGQIVDEGVVINDILTTLAQTTITARSGQTVILGGLISRSQGESTRRVPYLGDVPVLGRLFRYDSVSLERRELMFILTPYIMDTTENEALLNLRETERMSWCLADVVNVHGSLPAGAAGANHFSPQSPLIFPDVTPAGDMPMTQPGGTEAVPPGAPTPAQPPSGSPPSGNAGTPPPADPPKSARLLRLPSFLKRNAKEPQKPEPQAEKIVKPSEQPGLMPLPPSTLTPASITPANYQQSVPPDNRPPAANPNPPAGDQPSIYYQP